LEVVKSSGGEVKLSTKEEKRKIMQEAWKLAKNAGRKKPNREDFLAARRVVLGIKRR